MVWTLIDLGLMLVAWRPVETTQRMRRGENAEVRVPVEFVISLKVAP